MMKAREITVLLRPQAAAVSSSGSGDGRICSVLGQWVRRHRACHLTRAAGGAWSPQVAHTLALPRPGSWHFSRASKLCLGLNLYLWMN